MWKPLFSIIANNWTKYLKQNTEKFNPHFLNQAGRHAWFLKIDPVWIVGMHVCMCVYVCVCVFALEAINN